MMPFNDGRPFLEVDEGFEFGSHWEQPHYRATDPTPNLCYDDLDEPACRWKPSIHMPRWASRITLEVTNVRVERVQGIAQDEANAEGVTCVNNGELSTKIFLDPKSEFKKLWNSINEKKGFGWDMNPWVWVIEFKEVK